MKFKKNLQMIIIIFVSSLLVTACTSSSNQEQDLIETKELHIAAASDLRFAFEEIGKVYEEKEGINVVFQFGSSGNLAQQVSNGAPIDLFASANKNFIENLVKSGDIIDETKALYAIGRIVLAVNKNANVNITTLEDLLSDDIEHIALPNPNHAPYGMAGKEALESRGLWNQVENKLVYGESVSQAMQFVQTGNAPVGIISLSIADVKDIEYFPIDEELYNPLEQMLGVVSQSNNKELAKDFVNFLKSSEGKKIMEKYGFYLP